ncbi:MAG: MoaD/ThiS family protein [Deltaproteobacteria bacterium]|nr:MoaD/ThiS family protein [Deltaproteobacteria bacterium]
MNVKVAFMGELQRWAGRRELELDLPAGSRIGELAKKLFSLCGEIFAQRALTRDGAFQPHVAVFVNGVQIGRLEGSKTVLTGGKVESLQAFLWVTARAVCQLVVKQRSEITPRRRGGHGVKSF